MSAVKVFVVTVLLALLVPKAWSTEILIGTATLRFQAPSNVQPDGCSGADKISPDEEEICITMFSWGLYEAVGFRDLKGHVHSLSPIVAAAHGPLSGDWLLVLEKLPDEEAEKFGARYRVVDRSLIMPVACLDKPIGDYTTDEMPEPGVMPGLGTNCYNLLVISTK